MEDSKLIEKCLQHDRQSQKLLYERFSGQMYSICLRYCKDEFESQEALQNGFIKIFNNLASYKGTSPLFHWIKTIMIRSSLDQLKKKKREAEIFQKEENVQEVIGALDDEQMTYDEMIKIVQNMPTGYKTIFNLAVIDELPHTEISKLLGITESTSRTQLMKAKNLFRKQMLQKQNLYL